MRVHIPPSDLSVSKKINWFNGRIAEEMAKRVGCKSKFFPAQIDKCISLLEQQLANIVILPAVAPVPPIIKI